MVIETAAAGTVVRDRDGDLWVRTPEGAVVETQGGGRVDWPERDLHEADSEFGPFELVMWRAAV